MPPLDSSFESYNDRCLWFIPVPDEVTIDENWPTPQTPIDYMWILQDRIACFGNLYISEEPFSNIVVYFPGTIMEEVAQFLGDEQFGSAETIVHPRFDRIYIVYEV